MYFNLGLAVFDTAVFDTAVFDTAVFDADRKRPKQTVKI